MPRPRMLLPDTCYMVTRRCSERRFFLTPSSPLVVQIFAYCLAYGARQTGVMLHAWTVMGNHWHAVVTDPDARLPEFMALVDRLVAKCMNVHLGRFEAFWAPEPYSAVRLEDAATLLDKLLYVLANPVDAGLVESARQWPGLWSGPRAAAQGPQRVERPKVFFRADGPMPSEVELEAAVPRCFGHMTAQQLGTMLSQKLSGRERRLRREARSSKRRFCGPDRVKRQNPLESPAAYRPRVGINPTVACANKWGRVEMLQQQKSFQEAYAEAWRSFQKGRKKVMFPAGTYWMRRHARCATAAPL